jgi:hypothetical protein
MPLFYFDIANGRLIEDDSGQDFPDLEAAMREAISSARSIMRDEIWQGRLPLDECIRILDSDRRLLTVVRFRDSVKITGGAEYADR